MNKKVLQRQKILTDKGKPIIKAVNQLTLLTYKMLKDKKIGRACVITTVI